MSLFSKKSLRSKSTLGMLSVSLTILIVIMLLLFVWFRTEMLQGYHRLVSATLGHIEASFNQSLNDARLTVGKWYQSADGQSLCGDPNTTFVNHMPFINSTRGILENTGYYQSVCFINRQRESALYLGTSVSLPDHPEASLMQRADTVNAKNQFFTWIANRQYSDGEKIPYLAIPIADFPYNSDQFTGIAILTIDLLKFQSSLLADQPTSEFQICILDREGTVICHSNASLIGHSLQDEAWVQRVLSNRQRFSTKVDGTKYEFQTTGLNKNGFAIAIMSEYAAQAGSINKTANIIIFAIIIAAALQICLIMIISRRIFNPLTSVVTQMRQSGTTTGTEIPDGNDDEVMFLQQYNNAVSDRIQQLTQNRNRDFIAKNLILGIRQKDIQQLLIQSRIILPEHPYYMILVAVESQNVEEETMHVYDLMRGMVEHSLQSALSPFGQCSYFEIGLKRSLFFLSTDTAATTEDLGRTLLNVNTDLNHTLSARIHTAFSRTINDSGANCADEFRKLRDTLKSALILNRTAVDPTTEAALCTPDSSAVLNAVKAHDHDSFSSAVCAWLDVLPCFPYAEILPILSELGASIVRTGGLHSKTIGDSLDTLSTYDELLDWLESLYQKVDRQKSDSAKRTSSAMMEDAVDYIRNNPEDSNLSVNMLADRLHITPAYFGKLFQEFTGSKTLDYILQVRMERAKILLLTELHMDISEIAGQVGYNNSTYFTTAFKKYYGITPSKYRENYVINSRTDS